MKTLSEYVSWLNSMTTPELIKEFPGQFHTLNAKESSAECVKKMLANDAILWRMVKEYNQKLLSTEPVNSNNKPFVIPDVSGLLFDFLFYVRGGTQDVPEDEIRREIGIFLENYNR